MYEKSITREHRSAFVILIDQSGSMSGSVQYEGRTITKAAAVTEVANLIIGELIERARHSEGVRDYYDIGVVGYSGEEAQQMLGAEDEMLVSVSELAKRNVPIESYTTERVYPNGSIAKYEVSIPMWVTARAKGETPMYEGLNMVYDSIKEWCRRPENHDSFPPIIFNITDGESSDCTGVDMLNLARQIRSLSTSDGQVFMINVHITSDSTLPSMIFPTMEEVEECQNHYAKDLGLASSIIPDVYNHIVYEIKGKERSGNGNFVGVSYNTSIADLITILNIGTISVKKG